MKKIILFLIAITLSLPLFSSSLVVYFSATGNTEAVATTLAEITGSDIYEIVPAVPYTTEDLNYRNDGCRANREQNDPSSRPQISGDLINLEDYDTIYVGFPIWWGRLPKIMYTFFDSYDLSGKTIAPFCTSGGSGISRAVSEIRSLEGDATVLEGLRTNRRSASRAISSWLSDIGLD